MLKPLSRIGAALSILGTVVFALEVLRWVISRNFSVGFHASQDDGAAVVTFVHSMLILLLGITGALLPRHRIGWRMASRMLLMLAGGDAFALAVLWWLPHYRLAGAAFLPVVAVCTWALWQKPATISRTDSVGRVFDGRP